MITSCFLRRTSTYDATDKAALDENEGAANAHRSNDDSLRKQHTRTYLNFWKNKIRTRYGIGPRLCDRSVTFSLLRCRTTLDTVMRTALDTAMFALCAWTTEIGTRGKGKVTLIRRRVTFQHIPHDRLLCHPSPLPNT